MSSQDSKEQEDQGTTARTGGNVQTKGASQAPPSGGSTGGGGNAPAKPSGGDQTTTSESGKEG